MDKISKDQLKQIEEFTKSKLNKLDLQHTQEVRKSAKMLAQLEGADAEVVDIAAIFHDAAKKEAGLEKHDEVGAQWSKIFLSNLGIDKDFIDAVYNIIYQHSAPWIHNEPWFKQMPMPDSIEAKVMFDADMLAQMTKIGIEKNLHDYKDEPRNLQIQHSFRDIKKYAFENLLTENGKRIGKEMFEQVKKVFNTLE